MFKKVLSIILVAFSVSIYAQTGWQTVSSFGTNPGNLNMYSYVPTGITGKAPLVVVMHGCTQNAITVATQSGWNTLADRHKFFVMYPEQNSANNSSTCFNWFVQGDENRNQGEAYSIKQMVDYMKAHYNIDTTQIFATGLSAGACMTNVMLACYPDVFKAGAVMAGAPYKAGSSALYGYTTAPTPQAWGDSVKTGYPAYTGAYPKVAVFQGSSDFVVSPSNETEIMKQWTNIHGTDQTADATVSSFNGNAFVTKNTYNDNNGNEVVETYTLSGMGHAIALDTGSCYQQCGATGTYALEVYFSSTFWAAYFFNILNNNAVSVNGLQTVLANQASVTYSVTSTSNTTYTWTVPAGASITNGQGTNQITVTFSTTSGNVSVTETSSSCKVGPLNLFVNVSGSSAINQIVNSNNDVLVYPNPSKGQINIQSKNMLQIIKITNLLGEVIYSKQQVNTKENSIDVSSYPIGIYLLYTQEEGKTPFIQKIILE
ncbi:MAG TPA: PHB depolymerase family esterase [Bacteroidia bacterium]|jgi:poly(hydroxyalkanoate) depolymerase family esterase|nr:PHB depolymerase family esterase [Bacteroidia bacterium]